MGDVTSGGPESDLIDCLVIGGGPAGLSAAIQLGRLRRSTVLVDDDAGRSLWSQVTRNHLGFPDGISASELRLLGQRQAVTFNVGLRNGEVTRLRLATDGRSGFTATVAAASQPDPEDVLPGLVRNRLRERQAGVQLGERQTRNRVLIRARTVLLAPGVIDAFPSFVGRDDCVGVSLFWCIICDGYESIGRHVAVVGDDEEAIGTAFGLLHFTDQVTLLTGRVRSRASSSRLHELREAGVTVVSGPVLDYRHANGQIESIAVRRGGRDDTGTATAARDPLIVTCDMVFVSTPKQPRTRLALDLGATADGNGYLLTDDAGRTSVPGLYAAGDATAGHSHQVTTAAHLGAKAATAVNYDLYTPIERG